MNIPSQEDSFRITKTGLKALKKELQAKKDRKNGPLKEQMQDAWQQGDERENDAFTLAFEEYNILLEQITIIEDILKKVILIEPKATDVVQLGHKVGMLRRDGGFVQYQLVGDIEVDVLSGKISLSSPIAAAILGKKVGDVVEVQTPNGKIEYTIEKIEID